MARVPGPDAGKSVAERMDPEEDGDVTTREIREDADGDPMAEQTEPVSDSSAPAPDRGGNARAPDAPAGDSSSSEPSGTDSNPTSGGSDASAPAPDRGGNARAPEAPPESEQPQTGGPSVPEETSQGQSDASAPAPDRGGPARAPEAPPEADRAPSTESDTSTPRPDVRREQTNTPTSGGVAGPPGTGITVEPETRGQVQRVKEGVADNFGDVEPRDLRVIGDRDGQVSFSLTEEAQRARFEDLISGREGAARAVGQQYQRQPDFMEFEQPGKSTPGGRPARKPSDEGYERPTGGMTPYQKLSMDVSDSEPAPIEFYKTPSGETRISIFSRKGDVPDDYQKVTTGEALLTQFATPDTDITTDLTTSGGFLTESEEAALRDRANTIRDYYGVGDEAEALVSGATGSEKAGKFAKGVGKFPGDVVSAVTQAGLLGETAVETGVNANRVAEKYGTDNTWEAIGESAGATVVAVGREVKERPYEFAGGLAADVLAGTAAFKAVDKAGDISRRSKLSTKETVDLEDVTSERGAGGELPKFETSPDAPTQKAVREVEERAADNPTVVKEGTGGESTVYHGTQSEFDRNLEVGEGASELPGLFTSPDASPIALQGIRSKVSRTSIKPRLPRPGGKQDRFLGLPGDDVRGMESAATGAGYALRQGDDVVETGLSRGGAKSRAADDDTIEVVSDPTTSGYKFLTEQAEPGAAYVRPRGSRTTELEAILPPGSEFKKTGTVGVRVGRRQFPGTNRDIPGTGRTVPLDLFKRADADAPEGSSGRVLEDLESGQTTTARSLSDDVSRLRDPEGSVAAGGAASGGAAGIATSATGLDPFDSGSASPSGGSSRGVESSLRSRSPTSFSPASSPIESPGSSGGPSSDFSGPLSGSPASSGGPSGSPSRGSSGVTDLMTSGSSTSGSGSPTGSGSGSGTSLIPFVDGPSSPPKRASFDLSEGEGRRRFDREFGGERRTKTRRLIDPLTGK